MAGTGVILDVKTTGGTTLFAVEDTTETTLVVNSQDGQTSHPFEIRDAFGITTASIDISGNISGNHISFADGTTQTTAAGGSTTGTPSGVAFFGDDNLHTESSKLTFRESGRGILNIDNSTGILRVGKLQNTVGTQIQLSVESADSYFIGGGGSNTLPAWKSFRNQGFGFWDGHPVIFQSISAGTVGVEYNGGGPNHFAKGSSVTVSLGLSSRRWDNTYSTLFDGYRINLENNSSSNVVATVKGAAAQSANLQEWQDSSAGVLAHVDNQGMISGTGITYSDGTSQTSLFSTVETNANSGITLSCSDAGKYIRCTHAVSVDITIPSGLSCYDYTEYMFEQAGAGQISVTGNAGVTLNTSSSAKSRTQYSVITIKKVAADTYTVFGDVE
jgi:regulation of enolase protein 1 (concanavalin A-like superfamily)